MCGAYYVYQTETDAAKKYLTVDSREAVVVFTGVVLICGLVMAIVGWASGGRVYYTYFGTADDVDYIGASVAGFVFMLIYLAIAVALKMNVHPLMLKVFFGYSCVFWLIELIMTVATGIVLLPGLYGLTRLGFVVFAAALLRNHMLSK